MLSRRWLIGLIVLCTLPARVPGIAAEVNSGRLDIGTAERLLVVAPHPDDETLGAGGLIQRVLARSGSARVVLVTAGDGYVEAVVHETGQPRPRPTQYIQYGGKRLREARTAMRVLGGSDRLRLQFLGFPDGGLQGLLRAHWLRRHPERSVTTGASDPPYDEAVEPDVPYDGADLRRELVNLIRETRPTLVVLPDPLDKHPDHHAAGIFTLLAIKDYLRKEPRTTRRPRLLAYLVHWPDWPPGWDAPTPNAIRSDVPLILPSNLPSRGLAHISLTLHADEIATKRAALATYASQQEVMPALLATFVRQTEPFTVFNAAELHHLGHWIELRAAPSPTPRDEAK